MRNLIIIIVALVFLGCSSTQDIVVDPVKEKQLKEWIDNKQLKLLATTASPISTLALNELTFMLPNGSTPNRVILTSGEDYFIWSEDTIEADLPYFGTQQMAGEYNAKRGAMKFKGKYKSYKVDYDERKKVYTLKFKISDNRESFNVIVKVFANHKATLSINTSHRTAISYDGAVKGDFDRVAMQ